MFSFPFFNLQKSSGATSSPGAAASGGTAGSPGSPLPTGSFSSGIPGTPHSTTAMRTVALSSSALPCDPRARCDGVTDTQGVSALIQALYSTLNNCADPTREAALPADVKKMQTKVIARIIDVEKDRLSASLLHGNARDCESIIVDIAQWIVAKAACAAVRADPSDPSATVAGPVDFTTCIVDMSQSLRCGALSALSLVADCALFGDAAMLSMLLSQPDCPDVAAAHFHDLLTRPLLAALVQFDPSDSSMQSSSSSSSSMSTATSTTSVSSVALATSGINTSPAAVAARAVAENEDPQSAADARAFLASCVAVVGAQTLLREQLGDDGNASFDADSRRCDELWMQFNTPSSPGEATQGASTASKGRQTLQEHRRSVLERVARRVRCAVLLRRAVRQQASGCGDALATAFEALDEAGAVGGVDAATTISHARRVVISVLLHDERLAEALAHATELLSSAEAAWRSQPKTFRRGLALLQAYELAVQSSYRNGDWDGALQKASMLVAHAQRVSRLAEVPSDREQVDALCLQMRDATWKLYLHINQRVPAATEFYEYVRILQLRQRREFESGGSSSGVAVGDDRASNSTNGSFVRGGGGGAADAREIATASLLSDAYSTRAEMLLAMSASAKLATGNEEEEAISMYRAAIETCAKHEAQVPSLAERRVDLQCRIAAPYLALAAKEGNKAAQRQMAQEAITFAYDVVLCRSAATALQKARATIVIARGLSLVQQSRKAAMLLETLADDCDRLGDAELGLEARAVQGRCLADFAPSQATALLQGLVAPLEAQLALAESKSGAASPTADVGRARRLAKGRKRLLAEICLALGDAAMAQGPRHDDALTRYSTALERFADAQLSRDEAAVFGRLARVYSGLGQHATALSYLQQMLDLARGLSDEKLAYEATAQMADTHAAMGKHAEAVVLWGQLVQRARQFEDSTVERATLINIIRTQQDQQQWRAVIESAKALEQLCGKAAAASGGVYEAPSDIVFAIQVMADAYLRLGKFKKCVEVVDRLDSIEGLGTSAPAPSASAPPQPPSLESPTLMRSATTGRKHLPAATVTPSSSSSSSGPVSSSTSSLRQRIDLSAIHSIRARALIALRDDGAAIDVLQEWLARARASGNLRETAKAHLALSNALARVSPLEARSCFFDVIETCRLAADAADAARAPQPGAPTASSTSNNAAAVSTPNSTSAADSAAGGFGELSAMTFTAVRWLLDSFYLVEEPIEIVGESVLDADELQKQETVVDFNEYVDEHGNDVAPPAAPADDDDDGEGEGDEGALLADQEAAPELQLVMTLSFSVALEILEVGHRFVLRHTPLHVYRSPRTALEIALGAKPITWVFYSAADEGSASGGSGNSPTASSSRSRSNEPSSPTGGSGGGAVGGRLRYTIVIRPARFPCFYKLAVDVRASVLQNYHSLQRVMGTDDLYLSLRGLYEGLWEPVANLLVNCNSTNVACNSADCIAIVPDPSLVHVPFASLVSVHRKTVAQRSPITVLPCLDAYAATVVLNEQLVPVRRSPTAPIALLPERQLLATVSSVSMESSGSTPERRSSSGIYSSAASAAAHGLADSGWAVAEGCTRKELWSTLATDRNPACCVLLDASDDHGLHTVDGYVSGADLATFSNHPPERHTLVVVNDRSFRPSISSAGFPARFVGRGCLRVLRVDMSPRTCITAQHEHFICRFFEVLDVAISNGMAHPHAVAFQAAHCDAIRRHIPPHVWASFSLMGAP